MRKSLSPGRLSLAYAVVGALWIGFSDWLLTLLVDNPTALVRIGTIKGYAFVVATAGLLYLLAPCLAPVARPVARGATW